MEIKKEYEERAKKILKEDVIPSEYGFENTTEIIDWAIDEGLKDIENDLGIINTETPTKKK